MGYYIFSFGVKVKEVLDTFSSKDDKIIKKVEQNEYFENYCEEERSEFTTKNALHDIINGKDLNQKYAYEYGYAIISICATLGKELPYRPEIKLGYETDYINQFLKEDFGLDDFDIEEFLFSDEKLSFFPIPYIEDFPMISVVKLEQLKELKAKFANIKISDDEIDRLINDSDNDEDEEKGYSYEHIKGIIDNIDFCIENELDLFCACH